MSATEQISSEILLRSIISQGVDVGDDKLWFCDVGTMRFKFNEIFASLQKFMNTNSDYECDEIKKNFLLLQSVIQKLLTKTLLKESSRINQTPNTTTTLTESLQSKSRPTTSPEYIKTPRNKSPNRKYDALGSSKRATTSKSSTPLQHPGNGSFKNKSLMDKQLNAPDTPKRDPKSARKILNFDSSQTSDTKGSDIINFNDNYESLLVQRKIPKITVTSHQPVVNPDDISKEMAAVDELHRSLEEYNMKVQEQMNRTHIGNMTTTPTNMSKAYSFKPNKTL